MSEDKLQIAIYRIDETNDSFQDGDVFDILVENILSKGYAEQKIKDSTLEEYSEYKIKLFYKKNPSNPKWKDFLYDIVETNEDIIKKGVGWNEGFIMIFSNTESGRVYAISGGSGYHIFQEYINDDFGIDILSRLIKKEDKILKSVKEKSVVGGVLGATKYFRNNYNLFENDSFGKIYQELKANLNTDYLDKFGFTSSDFKNDSTCIAKASFKINKSIIFEQIFRIVEGCEYVFENPDNKPELEPVQINSVKKLTRKRDQDLINRLDEKLNDQLWARYEKEKGSFDFDLCHKDFEKYLSADKYVIKKNNSKNNYFDESEFRDEYGLVNMDIVFEKIKEQDDAPNEKNDFIELIRSLVVYSYNEEDEDKYITRGSIISHVFGDVSLDGGTYFFIDNNWYEIDDRFKDELNSSCDSFIKDNYNNGLNDKAWDYNNDDSEKRGENYYNKQFISDNPKSDKILVLDKITPDNIEMCDIMKWNDDNLYLYHVKAGFCNTMRDLCSQIFIAANRVKSDLDASREYIGSIYDTLARVKTSDDDYYKNAGAQTDKITKEEFIKIFSDKKKNLVFVISVLDTGSERKLNTGVSKFNSNIAKFSLQELIKGMRGLGVELKITQIFKSE